MKFRPCIDIHNGKVKQIVGGSLTDDAHKLKENFVSKEGAAYYAEMYKRDSLTGGHIIMLGAGNEEEALQALRSYPDGLQIGGGITKDNAAYYIKNGATHVIVTSYVFKDGFINFDNLSELVKSVGRERLVLDLSCRKKDDKYFVVTDRWQNFSSYEVTFENLETLASYCDEFLIHAVDVEGKCNGIQEDLLEKLGEWVMISTTYAGGIRSIQDIEALHRLGKGKIDFTVGSALDIFGGSLSYRKVVDLINNR